MSGSTVPVGYADLLADLKAQVRAARTRATRIVNTEMLTLYWSIGQTILDRQAAEGWGAKVIDRLADDLRAEFPDMRGLSRSNLKYMRQAAATWPGAIGQHAAGQLAWGHIMVLLDKVTDPAERDWYAAAAVEHGWTRKVVARGLGLPCVTGLLDGTVDEGQALLTARAAPIKYGDSISLDGSLGLVYDGAIAPGTHNAVRENLMESVAAILDTCDSCAKFSVQVNADSAEQALAGITAGARGVGLCRMEHMLLGERAALLAEAVLYDRTSGAQEVLSILQELLAADLYDLFRAASGMSVTVRLLDPPSNEFISGDASPFGSDDGRSDKLLSPASPCRETNPLLGRRGVRLSIIQPRLLDAQLDALVRATTKAYAGSRPPRVQLLVPMVTLPSEIGFVRDRLALACARYGKNPLCLAVGAMIETPRASLVAGELAAVCDFLSFGTNDLTALTWGLSREDSEVEIVPGYLDLGLLKASPLSQWDPSGVGRLVCRAVEDARKVRPLMPIGICGEVATDPSAAQAFTEMRVDYISCAPSMVRQGRLIAGRSGLGLIEKGSS